MGTAQQPGIIPQAIDDVFNYIRDHGTGLEYLLRVSYLEIYNENLRDLLNPAETNLRIYEGQNRCGWVN